MNATCTRRIKTPETLENTVKMNTELEHLIRSANQRLCYWSNKLLGKRKMLAFHNMLVKNELNPSQLCENTNDSEQLISDLRLMKEVLTHEHQIYENFTKMIFRIANKLAVLGKTKCVDKEDLISEGYLGLRSALVCYRDEKFRFSTYAYHCIRRRIYTVINSSTVFSNAKMALKLKRKYDIECVRGAGGPRKPEDIMQALNLSDKQKQMLRNILIEQVPVNLDKMSKAYRDEEPLKFANLDLSEFEKACLLANHDESGWQAEVARKYQNPKTGKPYSRAAVKFVLKRVYNKLAAA